MLKKSFFIYLSFVAVSFLLITGCNQKEVGFQKVDEVVLYGEDIPEASLDQGNIAIKVSEEFFNDLELKSDDSGKIVTSNVKSLNNAISSLGIVSMERTFPYAGEFEERTRKEGMHLWFDIKFDPACSMTRAGEELKKIDGVKIIEYQAKVVPNWDDNVVVYDNLDDVPGMHANAEDMPFDDPHLSRQWHYYNDGTVSSYAVEGCDINVLPVWKEGIVGNKDVIVSVVDQGVDYNHEDLSENMWHNPEKTGDEVYGYNFVAQSYKINPDEHGTHVAGTIAAVNNNGIGVCGIAGGDHAKGIPGVKIMSCQVFQGEHSGKTANAIKWGADHGAVISQNSWGYDGISYTPQTMKDAINYFIKYAGFDKNGNQVGPMAGGIVIFAAGNESSPHGYPAEYSKCFSVSALGPDYKAAYYTNYGKWIEVAAPGGDEYKRPSILSTIPNNKYGTMQGTSMACPHVSGVAALVVSHQGGPGFTCQKLWDNLLAFPKSIKDYNRNMDLGVGLINAKAAVLSGIGTPPEPITDLSITVDGNIVNYEFTVPKDEDSGQPVNAVFYYSTREIDEQTKHNSEKIQVSLGNHKAGQKVEGQLTGFDFDKIYYLAASVIDENNNYSKLSEQIKFQTNSNIPPEITPAGPVTLSIKKYQSLALNFKISDSNYKELTATVTPIVPGVFSNIKNVNGVDSLIVNINGLTASVGQNPFDVIVEDGFGGKTKLHFDLTVEPNHAPEAVKPFENILLNSSDKNPVIIKNDGYFKDIDGEPLFYDFEMDNKKIVSIKYEKGQEQFVLTPKVIGQVNIKIIAKDASNDTVSQILKVLVRDSSYPVDLYPNPVVDFLNVRRGEVTDNVDVKIYSQNGAKVFEGVFDIKPFNPARIDMTTLPGGVYSVVVKYQEDGKEQEFKSNVVKL